MDRHTFVIDQSRYATKDEYLYRGHFYSDKLVAMSLYGAGVAFVLRSMFDLSLQSRPTTTQYALTFAFVGLLYALGLVYLFQTLRLMSIDRRWAAAVCGTAGLAFVIRSILGASPGPRETLAYYLVTLMVVGVMYALGLAYLFLSLRLLGVDQRWAVSVSVAAGLGTLLLPYSSVFANHVVSGALAIIGFYQLLRVRDGWVHALLSGLLFALAASVELPYFVFLIAAPIALWRCPARRALAFFFGAAPVVAAFLWSDVALTGSVVPADLNPALWNYPGSIFSQETLAGVSGFHSVADLFTYGMRTLVGDFGLFTFTPIFLFSVYGFVRLVRARDFQFKTQVLFLAAACAAYVLLAIFKTSDFGGWSYGFRSFAGLAYGLCLPLGFLPDMVAGPKVGFLYRVALTLSICLALLGLIDPYPRPEPLASNLQPFLVSGQHFPIAAKWAFAVGAFVAAAALANRLASLARPAQAVS